MSANIIINLHTYESCLCLLPLLIQKGEKRGEKRGKLRTISPIQDATPHANNNTPPPSPTQPASSTAAGDKVVGRERQHHVDLTLLISTRDVRGEGKGEG